MGIGTTKKRAEQEAARVAFQQLQEQTTGTTASLENAPERKASEDDRRVSEETSASDKSSKSVTA
jgi:hypothetical protein